MLLGVTGKVASSSGGAWTVQGEGVLAAPGLSSGWHGCPSPAFLERLGLSELFHRLGMFPEPDHGGSLRAGELKVYGPYPKRSA